ncbi:hypothetical protein NLU14_08530 [Marinobacter sp. 71-i]|uniref:Uncharacterized protein n=1 Tax=Marinobacter iranensis TaxID=2962607 RepID=A0ABT5Y9N7_9GAMM|nr:hypothetical protein [Marinobacter iranensis]MDF0750274.1 hypothetical protein [Marinobacter iranensis]
MCGGSDKPEQTEEEKELGRIAVERWNDYQTRFVPIENQFIEAVQTSDSDFESARGSANASVQQAFGDAEDNLTDTLTANGITPDSGRFRAAMDGIGEDRSLSLGTGLNETEMAVDNRGLKGLQSVVQMGQGQATDSISGMGTVAADATRDSIDRANRSFENRQAGLHLAGTVAGAGTQAMTGAPGLNTQGQTTPLYGNSAYVSRL